MNRYRVEPLTDGHDLRSFSCGDEPMDSWLRKAALRNQDEGTSRSHAWVDVTDGTMRGFFTLAPTTVQATTLSIKQRGGASPGASVPALLLAKLGLCRTLHRQTPSMGDQLLVAALGTVLDASALVGGRLLVVDTRNDRAAKLYKRNNFIELAADPSRLVIRMSTLRAAFEE